METIMPYSFCFTHNIYNADDEDVYFCKFLCHLCPAFKLTITDYSFSKYLEFTCISKILWLVITINGNCL